MVLKGIRVLDFGRYISGPLCGCMLADLGAEVIRVEKVSGSEDRYLIPVDDNGDGAIFLHLNRNKLGMTLNPMKPDARNVMARLVASADIIIANLPQESLLQMGLDYDTLRSYKPDIILVSSSAFGSKGPYANRTGFDGVGQSMCGNAYLSGDPDKPSKSFATWVDYSTALFAFSGTMAALMHKGITGEGQVVETSLLRSALMVFHHNNMEQYLTKVNRTATQNRSPIAGPGDIFETRDGHIILNVIGQPLFERWARMIGEEHWISDPRFSTDENRGNNAEILSERTQAWVGQYTTEQVLALLAEARIPAGPVLSPEQVFQNPHIQQSGMMEMVDYPPAGREVPMMPLPISFSGLDTPIRMPPPQLGEHTGTIMRGLGFNQDEIADLRSKRVI
ncbi:CaiB/BaiF CoA transferase family protein [Parahaliea mediterranea]|uniref:CoA transferase n=1 Tax=Parahaliea mediterranea TaxID=651086 RepID=A0A939DDN2_9GAMM|nr:CoA transferase [Parahaliea mediterranea]MBN7796180.1 CoA transferase [Parahaliea mediterranea]